MPWANFENGLQDGRLMGLVVWEERARLAASTENEYGSLQRNNMTHLKN